MPVWLARVLDLVLRSRREARLDEEIAAHLAALQSEHETRGLSPQDAALAARRAFGGPDRVKAQVRDVRGWPWLESLRQDVSFAMRRLARDRALSVPLVLVLSLGIGVSHLFFTLTYAYTMRGLPIAGVDRVFAIWTVAPDGTEAGVSHAELLDLRAAQHTFARVAAYTTAPITLGDEGRAPDRLDATYTTASGFEIAGVRAVTGRVLSEDDDRQGAPLAVVLTERVWQTRYQRDASVVGRQVLVNGAAATVVGIAPDASGFPTASAVFLPVWASPAAGESRRDMRTLRVFARLAEGKTAGDIAAAIEPLTAALTAALPVGTPAVRLAIAPINTRFFGGRIRGWLPFITAGVIVIAVASSNAGNLLLAGARARAREVAVRTAMGASRGRIVRQLLVESLVAGAIAAAIGFAISRLGVRGYEAQIPAGSMPYWFDHSIDPMVFAAVWLLALAAVILFAVAPALYASRTAVIAVLTDGGRADTGRRRGHAGGTLFLAVQLGLALILVAQVGVATLLQDDPLATDPLLDDNRVLTGTLTLPAASYDAIDERRAFQARVEERLRAIPGMVDVAWASGVPVEGSGEQVLAIEGVQEGATPRRAFGVDIDPGYFRLLGAALVRGRGFSDRDGLSGERVVIVNQRLATLYFPGEDAIGRRVALRARTVQGPDAWATIVGIAADIRHRPGAPAAVPIVYTPIAASAPATTVLFARRSTAVASAGDVREALREVDASVPLYRVRTLAAATRDATWVARMSATLANTVTLSAFVLATFGLFAVVSHRTAVLYREIGLRMALGASRVRIVRLVIGSVQSALTAGLLLGGLGVLAWNRAFAPPAADGTAPSSLTLVAVFGALAATAILGGLVPTWRAVRASPAEALRRE
jgi:predicted permease